MKQTPAQIANWFKQNGATDVVNNDVWSQHVSYPGVNVCSFVVTYNGVKKVYVATYDPVTNDDVKVKLVH